MKSEDIAKLAGVSRSTVSRVINNYPNVPEATREKVMKVVREYNYMPNTFARTLAGKRSNTIGLFFIITGRIPKYSQIAQNDYFAFYLSYLVDIANEMDYYVLVNTIRYESEFEKMRQAFLEKRIDGAIVIGTQDDTLLKLHLESIKGPVIVFDYDIEKLADEGYADKDISLINSVDSKGIEKAVRFLRDKGHKDIGFIIGNCNTRSARVRYQGFIDAMEKLKLEVNEDFLIKGEFAPEVSGKAIREAVKRGKIPTAYISSNDYMAIEALKVLQLEGYKIPEDVAIIGFDNVHMTERTQPTLTTLEPRFYDMSRKAVSILDSRLQQPDAEGAGEYCFDVDLIIRESC